MPIQYVVRRAAALPGAVSKNGASPIFVDSDDNTLKVIPGGAGSTAEVAAVLGVQPLVAITANTTLTPASHAGRTVIVNAAAGLTVTLPAATGSGAKYRLVLGTAVTSNSFVVAVASGTDFFRGVAVVMSDTAGSLIGFNTANTGTVATESDTLTWNRTTTGTAVVGDSVELEDIATAVWYIRTLNNASLVEATPFSASV